MKRNPLLPFLFIFLIILVIIIVIFMSIFNQTNENKYIVGPFDVKQSRVHGEGVFSQKDYVPDQLLFMGIDTNPNRHVEYNGKGEIGKLEKIHYFIPELATKINHCSSKVNVYLKKHEGGWFSYDRWYFYSKNNINVGDELYADYNNTPYFISKPDPTWSC
jgi:hypothetical protein